MDPQISENGIILQSFKLGDDHSTPRQVKNDKRSQEKGKLRVGTPLPLPKANLLSFTGMSWLTPIICQIARTTEEVLDDDAVWSIASVDGCQENAHILDELWRRELREKGRRNASFFKCCVRFVRPMFWRLMLASVLFAISLATLAVVVIRQIIRYLQNGEDMYSGFILVGAMFLVTSLQISTFAYNSALGIQYGTRLKGAAMYLAYEKVLRLETFRKNTVGVLVSIFTGDSLRLYTAIYRLIYASVFGTLLIAGISVSAYLIGWWMFVGAGIFALTTLSQVPLTRFSAKLQKKRLLHTDTRIEKLKEMLNNIRLIKMWAWETPFIQEIMYERKKETSKSQSLTFWTILGFAQIFQTPALATALTLTLYSYFGNTLNTELAFSVATTFSTMRFALAALPLHGRCLADAMISCRRIQDLLLKPEMKKGTRVVNHDGLAIEMRKAHFHWPSDVDEQGTAHAYSNPAVEEKSAVTGERKVGGAYILRNLSFQAKKGSLVGVCGRVGSGKSALMSALLGQMTQVEGSLTVNGTIAICPQEAWIFNDTLRENILFGSPYNKDRYEKALDLTCFLADLESFPAGDQTEIGDRGITLSGGQRQRLSLARALYSDRDIYLLDDPLSALDVIVGQRVFTRCIKQGLREKTVILTTHQLQYLQVCDLVIYLENGTVSEMGTHEELMKQAKEYSHMIKSFYEKTTTNDGQPGGEQIRQPDKMVLDVHAGDGQNGQLTEKESMGMGGVKWACYAAYIRSLGGATIFLFLLFCFMLTEALVLGCDWWLSVWLQQIDSDDVKPNGFLENILKNTSDVGNVTIAPDTEDVMRSLTGVSAINIDMSKSTFYMAYGIALVALCLTNILRCWVLCKTTIHSSRVLHKDALGKVMSSPVSFFDRTPSGRIMNRFSADTDTLDTIIPIDVAANLMMFFRIVIAIAGIAVIFPLLLVPLAPAVIAVMIIGRLGRASCLQMKRMDNVTRSKLVDHVTSTVQGLVSVRTYERENIFIKRLISYLDTNSTRYMLHDCCVEWTVLRGNFVGVILSVITSMLVVLFRQQIPSQLGGLALSMSIQVMTLIGPLIQQLFQFEARLTSVERLDEYIMTLESEGHRRKVTTSVTPDWPRSGDVTFNDVCMAYNRNSKQALKEVSFSVISGQSIGIIGRTGAGKSSLGTALFRLVELSSGSILIDGVDIAQLSLHQLRSRLSVIPQDPVLFAGSLRRNLDPMKNCTDEDIWTALKKSQLKEKVYHLPGQLLYYVENNGTNFSVGERQLLCMTRALLRKTPIVLLDEATASVDTETGSKIQLMLKDAFCDRTVLIIAHRLNTVQHCDKILVMDEGTVREFDCPDNLMNQRGSLYKAMLSGNSVE